MFIVRIIGGLGNQMFQYAFYRNLEHRFPGVKCDVLGFERYGRHNGFILEQAFNIKAEKATAEEIELLTNLHKRDMVSKVFRNLSLFRKTHITEKKFSPEILDKNKDLYLDGYWQSEKYFGDPGQLKLDFTFRTSIGTADRGTDAMMAACNSVSVHIRRGDYVGNNLYVQLDEEYYNDAMNLVKAQIKDAVFFIFSDDPSWVKTKLAPRLKFRESIIIVEKDTRHPENDMRSMALGKHNIIANSSFSWWGAWLNSNAGKMVVAPKRWFNNSGMNSGLTGQIPTSWIKI